MFVKSIKVKVLIQPCHKGKNICSLNRLLQVIKEVFCGKEKRCTKLDQTLIAYVHCWTWTRILVRVPISIPKMGAVMTRDLSLDKGPNVAIRFGIRIAVGT